MENHHIGIENRERMTITQVADVDAFDEAAVWVNLKDGGIEITGERLNIEKLDLEEGLLVVTGQIQSLSYSDKKNREKKSLLDRLGRK
jgi:sporulation protein YabP